MVGSYKEVSPRITRLQILLICLIVSKQYFQTDDPPINRTPSLHRNHVPSRIITIR